MNLNERLAAFINLGHVLKQYVNGQLSEDSLFKRVLDHATEQAQIHNAWFSGENIRFAIKAWANLLTEENLNRWLEPYGLKDITPKTVGIVTAGNIPMVGMHDFVSVLISGHKILVKQSSNDRLLLPEIAKLLIQYEPKFRDNIIFTEGKLTEFDAVIATGSNNTARYFESYFGQYPHIIRKNRNAVAVLTGDETEKELERLGEDIFRYYGLGCRSVSKVFVPEGYDINRIFKAIFSQQDIINHHKYKNNYDYNRAVYLMGGISILENGFILFKEDNGYASPIAVLYYEYYKSLPLLKTRLIADSEQIQCVVSQATIENAIPLGQSQQPELWDYADGVDTIEFLKDL